MTGALPATIGRYEVMQLIGQGAMGRVLLGRDPVLDRHVAIKLLRSDLKIPEDQRRGLFDRMRHEARASARISHPNIVILHDMGEDPELGLYLVHEYAEGTTLKERLVKGRLGSESAAQLAEQLGSALSAAHGSGVLHRDVKPENIILTENGAKIADFGIARIPDSTLTRDGGLLGTPAYSSPESIYDGTFSPASDQFSLAATLYEALSGRRAFPGTDAVQVAAKISTEQPMPVSKAAGLEAQVDDILLKGMAKDPGDRYPSAAFFGSALAEALRLSSRPMMPTLPDALHRKREQERASQERLGWGLGGALVGGLLGLAVFRLMSDSDAGVAPVPLRVEAPVVADQPLGEPPMVDNRSQPDVEAPSLKDRPQPRGEAPASEDRPAASTASPPPRPAPNQVTAVREDLEQSGPHEPEGDIEDAGNPGQVRKP